MTPGFPVIPFREEQVHKGRAAEAEGSEQLKGTKGTCTLRLNLSGALAFTGSASELCGQPKLRAHMGPTCFSISCLWSNGPNTLGSGENHTFKRNRVSSGSTLRASAPATWNQTPLLIRQHWPLSRGEFLPHT